MTVNKWKINLINTILTEQMRRVYYLSRKKIVLRN